VTPIRRLDHVAIAVYDTSAALEYFSGHLGLAVVSQEVIEDAKVRLTYLDAGNIFLQLVEPLEGPSPIRAALDEHGEGVHHLCFAVDDVAAGVAALVAGPSGDAVRLGRGRGRVSAFVPGPTSHGVRIECTGFDRAADVEGSAGWLDPDASPPQPTTN
jgi:methylmalonyl-CoA/ethylmalonyl-CoA epimerase